MRGDEYLVRTGGMDAGLWMSFWMNPHRVGSGVSERNVEEAIMTCIAFHPSTVVRTYDVSAPVLEDFPHLRPLLEQYEYLLMHQVLLDPEALRKAYEDFWDQRVREAFPAYFEKLTIDTDDGKICLFEYTHAGKYFGDVPDTDSVLHDAIEEAIRSRDMSIVASSDSSYIQLRAERDGTASIDLKMGEKMIDKQVDQFRSSIESWLGGGE